MSDYRRYSKILGCKFHIGKYGVLLSRTSGLKILNFSKYRKEDIGLVESLLEAPPWVQEYALKVFEHGTVVDVENYDETLHTGYQNTRLTRDMTKPRQ